MPNAALGHVTPDVSPPRARRPRLAALDGLRIAAALAVTIHHYVTAADNYWGLGGQTFPQLRRFTEYGWLGVDLFFMISGFVICMSSWDRGVGEFFVSRVTRLFPTYWFAVLLTSAVVIALPTATARPRLVQILANLTMAQTGLGAKNIDIPYWTLWPELLFYLLFTVVIWRGVTYRRVVIFCCVWTAWNVFAWSEHTRFVTALSPIYSMYFIAGVAMYLMYRFRPTLILWGIVGFSWLLAMYGVFVRLPALNMKAPHDWAIGATIVTCCFALMLATALGYFDRIQWRWLTIAGALTYPLYLVHMAVGLTIIDRLSPAVPRYVLLVGVIVSMLVLAWLIHRFVEKPVAAWLKPALTHGLADLRNDGAPPPVREHIPATRTELALSSHGD
jgi:peptidoglycan/LPS O-acetylase OafA/YrhL